MLGLLLVGVGFGEPKFENLSSSVELDFNNKQTCKTTTTNVAQHQPCCAFRFKPYLIFLVEGRHHTPEKRGRVFGAFNFLGCLSFPSLPK